jgi:hypothetical protein
MADRKATPVTDDWKDVPQDDWKDIAPSAPAAQPVGERPVGGPHAVLDVLRSAPGALADIGKGAAKGAFQMLGSPGAATDPPSVPGGFERKEPLPFATALSAPSVNTAETIGSYIPTALSLFAGGKGVGSLLPSTERAALNFRRAEDVAGKVAVDVSRFARPALEAQHLNAVTGDPLPPIMRKAFQSVQPTTNPLTYEDARLMASSAGRKAVQQSLQPQQLTGPMKAHTGALASGLDEATQEAATRAGVGDVHANAMREYRQAKALENAAHVAKKVATGAALAGGLYEGGKYVARKALQ